MTALGPCLYLPRRRIDVEEDIYLTKHKIVTNILLHVCCRYLALIQPPSGLNFNLHLKEEEKFFIFVGILDPPPTSLFVSIFLRLISFFPRSLLVCATWTPPVGQSSDRWIETLWNTRNTLTVCDALFSEGNTINTRNTLTVFETLRSVLSKKYYSTVWRVDILETLKVYNTACSDRRTRWAHFNNVQHPNKW